MQPKNSEHHSLHTYFIDITVFSLIACHCNGVVVMYGLPPLLQRRTSLPEGPVKPEVCIFQPCMQHDWCASPHRTHCRGKEQEEKEA